MPPVVVNLGIQVDANGEITVFGQQPEVVSEYVDCSVNLPTSALYMDSNNALFEFWEPSDAIGTRKATHAPGRNNTSLAVTLASGLQSILEGEMDASTSIPFSNSKYASESAYRVFNNVGRLALSSYAHYLFGHVAATAAITNDQDFMDKFLAYDTGAASAYDATSWAASSESQANLSLRLADAVLKKTDEEVLTIVEQVLGQDASRAKDQDNNELSPDVRQALEFKDGDVIYFTVRVQQPSVTVTNGAQQNVPAPSLFTGDGISYNLKVTLGGSSGGGGGGGAAPSITVGYGGWDNGADIDGVRTYSLSSGFMSVWLTNTGGPITSVSVSPALPGNFNPFGPLMDGLSWAYNGTFNDTATATTYTITATGPGGSVSGTFTAAITA